MFSKKAHLFTSKLEEQCIVESLILNIGLETIVTAVESIEIPTGSMTFLDSDFSEKEIIIVIRGCGTISENGNIYFVNPGEIIFVEANAMRSLSNIDQGFLQVVSIRYRSVLIKSLLII
jgi:quercetin dioxygenase-like cupin family protein